MNKAVIVLALVWGSQLARADDFSLDQRLVIACYKLQVDQVVRCLRKGANVNATFGEFRRDTDPFFDRWTGGTAYLGTDTWTPLLALTHASDYPDPPADLGEVWKDAERSRALQQRTPRETLDKRKSDATTILFILLSQGCKLDSEDCRGATALYIAADTENVPMAKTLLEFGANPNTKTGIYFDGPGDTTPLHVACQSRELMQLLLDHGADASAKDTNGETPADWVALHGDGSFDLIVSGPRPQIRPRYKVPSAEAKPCETTRPRK